jgi:hypothetical protein
MRKEHLVAARVYANAARATDTGDVVVLVSPTMVRRSVPSMGSGDGWGELSKARPGERPGQQRATGWGKPLLAEVGYLAVKITDKQERDQLINGVDDNGQPTNAGASLVMGWALVWAEQVAGKNLNARVTEGHNHRYALVIAEARTLRPLREHRRALVEARKDAEQRAEANRQRSDELFVLREQASRQLAAMNLSLDDPEDDGIAEHYRLVPVPVTLLAKLAQMAHSFHLIPEGAELIYPGGD